MPNTSERVRELIAASGLTHRAYADQIGLDTTKLSKSLRGGRRFTSLELARISELSNVTVDWLITGTGLEITVAARSNGGSAATAVHEAQRLSSLRSDMTFLGLGQPWQPLPREQNVRRMAEAARARVEEAGHSPAEPDLATVIEASFGVDVAISSLGTGFDGLSVSSDEVKLILVSTSQIPARQRFTLAHELGHLLAGDDQQLHIDENIYAGSYRLDPSEQGANAFAAAFLMPEHQLRAATPTTYAALADELLVSPAGLAVRLRELQLADDETCERLRQLTGAQAAQTAGRSEHFAARVAVASSVRPPGLLLRDTYQAYESGEATLRPYAALIGADVDQLHESLEAQE
ncbi:hypothetical protein GCM10022223_45220 [Kineosporia mesophila]|uniref:HTH cro/C1-type domain-containing protein n=1 Tax=Kineosporia mesophila TaxID=566012 RepID=A0ABP7A1Q3_9ACTN|nr:XRE family transcriptional regulator [Kineosporia mesophila]MCD5348941.1 XRE family transcriptional regulator [Kineosporia mesophila]